MEITPNNLPHPIVTAPSQQAVAQSLPQIQAMAAAPIIARAVDTSPKSFQGSGARSNEERAKRGESKNTDRENKTRVDIKV